ncbi:hypothetical protein SGRA_p0048 (plasmid) [Saprospira grandis str. Lewin]|uniref:Uncharacterized protein n=1 Tax=Saprospira grandis (strain Lewin) TaxID=984262 RepID=H6LB23_SAPGL|nr:hypothetical protein SGRA_p0048 [Saprospira grandis str. Lewin]
MGSSGPKGQTQAAQPPQGRADLRAATQPDPPAGRGSPKRKKPFPKKGRAL